MKNIRYVSIISHFSVLEFATKANKKTNYAHWKHAGPSTKPESQHSEDSKREDDQINRLLIRTRYS